MNSSESIQILIADDSREFRSILRLFLEYAQDMKVVGEAGDGYELLEMLNQMRPDVLLLDMRMPRMSGLEVLEQLQEKQTDVKVIIMSAHEGSFYENQALSRGATRYIVKGGAPEKLVQTIREVAEM